VNPADGSVTPIDSPGEPLNPQAAMRELMKQAIAAKHE
jgi:hypothetical protein